MRICLVGPGIMSIPPTGWGAVEILIWDYYNVLIAQGIETVIINKIRSNGYEQSNINSSYCRELINQINTGKFDFVHIHYDCLFHIIPYLTCKKIGMTSHYPYIDKEEHHRNDGFSNIFRFMIDNNRYIHFVLAYKDLNYLSNKGADIRYLCKLENGVSPSNFYLSDTPLYKHKTIYLGKISQRKGQEKYCNMENIDIIGPGGQNLSNWKGEWTREDVFNKLTHYGNLLLFSKGEADPLVVKEALICGLGVVVNETSAKNLTKQDFITIVKDDEMDNIKLIQQLIDENRKISLTKRNEIRKYGESLFGWNTLIQKYLNKIID